MRAEEKKPIKKKHEETSVVDETQIVQNIEKEEERPSPEKRWATTRSRASEASTRTFAPRPAEASRGDGRVLLVPVDCMRRESNLLLQWAGEEPTTPEP